MIPAVLLALALSQGPIDEEIYMLRARVRELEVEMGILKDRADLQAVLEQEEQKGEIRYTDVAGLVTLIVAALEGMKYAKHKMNGNGG